MRSATGTYEHALDAKGRVVIPSALREALGDELYLSMGLDGCLALYSKEKWESFTQKYAETPMFESADMRLLFCNADCCEPDGQGRIVIKDVLRRFARIDKKVVIIGVHDRAEIWSAERWQEREATAMTPEKMNELLARLRL